MCESIVSVCSSSSSLDFWYRDFVCWFRWVRLLSMIYLFIPFAGACRSKCDACIRRLIAEHFSLRDYPCAWAPVIVIMLFFFFLCSSVQAHTRSLCIFTHAIFTNAYRTHTPIHISYHTHTRIYMQPSHSGIVVCVWCLSQALTWMQTLSCDFFSLPKRAMQ